jgi:hypothetical protein
MGMGCGGASLFLVDETRLLFPALPTGPSQPSPAHSGNGPKQVTVKGVLLSDKKQDHPKVSSNYLLIISSIQSPISNFRSTTCTSGLKIDR